MRPPPFPQFRHVATKLLPRPRPRRSDRWPPAPKNGEPQSRALREPSARPATAKARADGTEHPALDILQRMPEWVGAERDGGADRNCHNEAEPERIPQDVGPLRPAQHGPDPPGPRHASRPLRPPPARGRQPGPPSSRRPEWGRSSLACGAWRDYGWRLGVRHCAAGLAFGGDAGGLSTNGGGASPERPTMTTSIASSRVLMT